MLTERQGSFFFLFTSYNCQNRTNGNGNLIYLSEKERDSFPKTHLIHFKPDETSEFVVIIVQMCVLQVQQGVQQTPDSLSSDYLSRYNSVSLSFSLLHDVYLSMFLFIHIYAADVLPFSLSPLYCRSL